MSRVINQQFQVVILAGGHGSKMNPLAKDIAKPLLRVGNRPLISYVLEMMQKAQFDEVIIVTHSQMVSQIQSYLETSDIKSNTRIITVKEDLGTADVLRSIREQIRSDFIVISSDLITDAPLHHVADIHRVFDSTVTLLLHQEEKETLTQMQKDKFYYQDYIGLNEDNICFFGSSIDFEKRIKTKPWILNKYGEFSLHRNLTDSHIYIFSRWILDLLSIKKEISSIKGDLIPYLVSKQATLLQKEKYSKIFKRFHKQAPVQKSINCIAVIDSKEPHISKFNNYENVKSSNIFIRVNTVSSYKRANFEIAKATSELLPFEKKVSDDFVDATTNLVNDPFLTSPCIIGQCVSIGAKSVLMKSIIGPHCKIGENVKIQNSIIMDHVTIGNDCVINDSVICSNSLIQNNCELVSCVVGSTYSIEENSSYKNKLLKNMFNFSK
ncbi:translation initiation factor eif-2b subunit gamma [Anaeramoeba ignava]|uniref:Translation initiation factor eIF2B subunit gamma n=1 Tax=Anaeramoeba ignava TaxID=1746090 RepID=A0A9Q0LKS1_ANAIG|nr:translation initiation factor eif-2b subunit gamma [Anaeramoeba ignava]